ncbi:radical SAM protein [archaeon SCG-AAA382B04]|nr:radical SAM protein [archaeon SCG-AAA382B04]
MSSSKKEKELDALIIDGYVDEPSQLGVPPYLSPEPRYTAGMLEKNRQNWQYKTIDQIRQTKISKTKNLLVYGGVTVPGNYLGGKPLTKQEAKKLAKTPATTYLAGPLARYQDIPGYDYKIKKDLSASFNDHLNGNRTDRWKTQKEREQWTQNSTKIIKKHPTPKKALMIEIELYRGCPRYYKDGCSFCTEPYYGKPVFREQKDVSEEIQAYNKKGVTHFRIGAQSCTISYKAKHIGEKDPPTPRPQEIKKLFKQIWRKTPTLEVLHLDNANPAIIAKHPNKSQKIIKTLVKKTTPGNVLALGLETADKEIIQKNNLNTTPQQTHRAIELINKHGKQRGKNGLPKLLPGLNFLSGLHGETKQTYQKNHEFLKKIKKQNLWLRRTNIRKVLSRKQKFKLELEHKREHHRFKQKTRQQIDKPMLKKIAPTATTLKNVYIEKTTQNQSLGRQIATYPLLIKIPNKLPKNTFQNIAITDHKPRSLRGIKHPLKINQASYQQIKNLPYTNNKKAAELFQNKPITTEKLKKTYNKQELKKIQKITKTNP